MLNLPAARRLICTKNIKHVGYLGVKIWIELAVVFERHHSSQVYKETEASQANASPAAADGVAKQFSSMKFYLYSANSLQQLSHSNGQHC